MTRIPLVKPEHLSTEQADLYHNTPGGKMNISMLLAHGEHLPRDISQMARSIFTQSTLSALEREISVLAVLHLDRGEYEWAQHVQIALSIGIPQEKIEAIAQERFGAPIFDDREKALLAFTRQVVKSVRVDDYVFKALRAFYEPKQIVDLTHTIGFYMMLVRLTEVAELELDVVHGAEIFKTTVAEHAAKAN